MTISYQIKKGHEITKEIIDSCDDGAKGMQGCLVEVARTISPWSVPLVWIATRFYTRKISNNSISYEFYLIKG